MPCAGKQNPGISRDQHSHLCVLAEVVIFNAYLEHRGGSWRAACCTVPELCVCFAEYQPQHARHPKRAQCNLRLWGYCQLLLGIISHTSQRACKNLVVQPLPCVLLHFHETGRTYRGAHCHVTVCDYPRGHGTCLILLVLSTSNSSVAMAEPQPQLQSVASGFLHRFGE